MRIDSASYRVESTHRAAVREETRESLRVWSSAPAGDALDVSFSSAARASLAADAGSGIHPAPARVSAVSACPPCGRTVCRPASETPGFRKDFGHISGISGRERANR